MAPDSGGQPVRMCTLTGSPQAISQVYFFLFYFSLHYFFCLFSLCYIYYHFKHIKMPCCRVAPDIRPDFSKVVLYKRFNCWIPSRIILVRFDRIFNMWYPTRSYIRSKLTLLFITFMLQLVFLIKAKILIDGVIANSPGGPQGGGSQEWVTNSFLTEINICKFCIAATL